MAVQLRDRARGRWSGILATMGVAPQLLTGKHTCCPICGQGKDRFRYDDRDGNGTWICSKCGAGDGVQLLMAVKGWSFKETAQQIESIVGTIEPSAKKEERPDQDKREAMNRLWASAAHVQASDPVGRYLFSRCRISVFPPVLRYGERVRYQAEPTTWHPAMIAMIHGADGKPAILHRTYLTKDGRKAVVEAPRRLMPGSVPKGCAVRLAPHAGTLGIAEGIETALSAAAIFGVPCWAAVNANMLANWVPPADAKEIIVFGDNDESFTGQQAAFTLAHRLRSQGLAARVEIPATSGTDWNDMHRRQDDAA